MEDVKLPDIEKLRAVKQRLKQLPPQKSATDTSNWENRNVSAVTFDYEAKKRKVRQVDFLKAKQEPFGLTLDQVKQVLKDQGFSPEQIQQKIDESNNRNKTSN
jgi:hypothetical protein